MTSPTLKRFRIVIEQPMLTEITVKAPDLDAAVDLAGRCYEGDETAIEQSDPWYGCWDIIETEEVQQ